MAFFLLETPSNAFHIPETTFKYSVSLEYMVIFTSNGQNFGIPIPKRKRKYIILPNTIQITMLFPMMAVKSIVPNRNVHSAFCSTEISYGRTGGDLRHSPINSLWQIQWNLIFFLTKTAPKKRNRREWERKICRRKNWNGWRAKARMQLIWFRRKWEKKRAMEIQAANVIDDRTTKNQRDSGTYW